jgi:hypothetical protein
MNKIIVGAMANKFLARVSSFTGVFNFHADFLLCLIENDLSSLHPPMNTPYMLPLGFVVTTVTRMLQKRRCISHQTPSFNFMIP